MAEREAAAAEIERQQRMAAQEEAERRRDAVEKLREVQEELQQVNQELNFKITEIEQTFNRIRGPVYANRNDIISSIDDFWLTCMLCHPSLRNLLSDEDQKIFDYLDSLHVEESENMRDGYCISFNFKPNLYFENAKLSKTIKFLDEGKMKSTGTSIDWKEGMAPADPNNEENVGNKRPLPSESFFSWFGEDKEVDKDEVAEIIRNELWPNPLRFLDKGYDEENSDEDEADEEDENDENEDDEVGE